MIYTLKSVDEKVLQEIAEEKENTENRRDFLVIFLRQSIRPSNKASIR